MKLNIKSKKKITTLTKKRKGIKKKEESRHGCFSTSNEQFIHLERKNRSKKITDGYVGFLQ